MVSVALDSVTPMKYSLRSLMIAVLVLPPLLAWGAVPLYRRLMTPEPISERGLRLRDTYGKFTRRQTLSDSSAPVPNLPKP